MTSEQLPIIGISMGDPAGIGPEICAKTLALKEIYDMYNLPHRYFHNVEEHLLPVLCNIYDSYKDYVEEEIIEQSFIILFIGIKKNKIIFFI